MLPLLNGDLLETLLWFLGTEIGHPGELQSAQFR